MARAVVNVMKVSDMNMPATPAACEELLTAFDTDGAEFKMGRDDKTIILLYNDSENYGDVTVWSGNGMQGKGPLYVLLKNNEYRIVCLDSGHFKNVSGEDKGKVILTCGNTAVKIAVFEAP